MEAINHITDKKNIELFGEQNILTCQELCSKQKILQDNYRNTVLIETRALIKFVVSDIIPSIFDYKKHLLDLINANRYSISSKPEGDILNKLANLNEIIWEQIEKIKGIVDDIEQLTEYDEKTIRLLKDITYENENTRVYIEDVERIMDRKYWRFCIYDEFMLDL